MLRLKGGEVHMVCNHSVELEAGRGPLRSLSWAAGTWWGIAMWWGTGGGLGPGVWRRTSSPWPAAASSLSRLPIYACAPTPHPHLGSKSNSQLSLALTATALVFSPPWPWVFCKHCDYICVRLMTTSIGNPSLHLPESANAIPSCPYPIVHVSVHKGLLAWEERRISCGDSNSLR
jgi:hypothetical protein